jgi:hypothetical protein
MTGTFPLKMKATWKAETCSFYQLKYPLHYFYQISHETRSTSWIIWWKWIVTILPTIVKKFWSFISRF